MKAIQTPRNSVQSPPVSNRPLSAENRPKLRWRTAILGTVLVTAGLSAAAVTILARRTNDSSLATAAALLSLVIAGLLAIFVVPPLARAARLEVKNLDLPVEITAGGLIFSLILLIVGFAAWNTGNNLLFLVLSLLFSTLFVGAITARAVLRDLVVSARFPDHIFAGEPAPVIVTLRNTKRLFPSFSILVEARGPVASVLPRRKRSRRSEHHKRTLAYFTYIPSNASAEQRVEQLFERRGHVLINGFEISTRFPFGFFRTRRRLRARNVDIVVYPKPLPKSEVLNLLPVYAGRMESHRRGAGHDLFSLRDYQPRDDLRHIDWKATARARRLTVREFTAEDERRVAIVLDTEPGSKVDEQEFPVRFEEGVVQAASLVKHFIGERAEVRLTVGAESGRYGAGLEHLYGCLRRLALAQPRTGGDHQDEEEMLRREENDPADDFAILITSAAPGSIPAKVWRSSHVVYY